MGFTPHHYHFILRLHRQLGSGGIGDCFVADQGAVWGIRCHLQRQPQQLPSPGAMLPRSQVTTPVVTSKVPAGPVVVVVGVVVVGVVVVGVVVVGVVVVGVVVVGVVVVGVVVVGVVVVGVVVVGVVVVTVSANAAAGASTKLVWGGSRSVTLTEMQGLIPVVGHQEVEGDVLPGRHRIVGRQFLDRQRGLAGCRGGGGRGGGCGGGGGRGGGCRGGGGRGGGCRGGGLATVSANAASGISVTST